MRKWKEKQKEFIGIETAENQSLLKKQLVSHKLEIDNLNF